MACDDEDLDGDLDLSLECFDDNRYEDDFDVVSCDDGLDGDLDFGCEETVEDCACDDEDLDGDFDFCFEDLDEECVCDDDFEI